MRYALVDSCSSICLCITLSLSTLLDEWLSPRGSEAAEAINQVLLQEGVAGLGGVMAKDVRNMGAQTLSTLAKDVSDG